MNRLSDDVEIRRVAAAAADGTSAVNGSAIDLSGFEGVTFISTINVANAGNYLKAQEGDTSSPTADLAGSKVTADNGDDAVVLDIHKPLKRYIRPVIIRAGSTTVSGEVYALLWKSRSKPRVSDVTNALNLVALVSPVAGTP